MESNDKKIIRVGSRKSELALIQTNHVIECLKKTYTDVEFNIVTMSTLGDRILNVSLPKIGEKSLFTKDLEDALRNETVDFVVHSLKDLPTTLPDRLAIGAVFEREDPRDALVLREDLKDHSLITLPPGSVIGTSSLRRTAQLHGLYPHLKVIDVRGNLNTRLRKLDSEGKEYSALLLAKSGLTRMGWEHRISKTLPCSEMMYATGQGALAVECRSDAHPILEMLAKYNHAETYCRVLAERSFLKTLGGGCSAPVGVSTSLKPFDASFKLTISGAVWSLDGTTKVDHRLEEIFPIIRKTSKHKLSPDEDVDRKKPKASSGVEASNPIGEMNKRISERSGNLNCVDMRTDEEIEELRKRSLENSNIYRGLSENTNVSSGVEALNPIGEMNKRISERSGNLNCVDMRTDEEIEELRKRSLENSNIYRGLSENRNMSSGVEALNPIGEMNKRISERSGNLNCVDMRTDEEIEELRKRSLENSNIYRGLSENRNMSSGVEALNPIGEMNKRISERSGNLNCVDMRTDEEIEELRKRSLENSNIYRGLSENRNMSSGVEALNPIGEMNKRISERSGNLNCVDMRTDEEIEELRKRSLENSNIYRGLSENTNMSSGVEALNPIGEMNKRISERSGNLNCVDTRTDEEIEELRIRSVPNSNIYCGLTENTNIPIDVIIKCEELGKELANILISKGALEVMKVTQDLIRSSIEKKS